MAERPPVENGRSMHFLVDIAISVEGKVMTRDTVGKER
jgi:hypothetical protein